MKHLRKEDTKEDSYERLVICNSGQWEQHFPSGIIQFSFSIYVCKHCKRNHGFACAMLYYYLRVRVVKVVDFKPIAPRSSRFEFQWVRKLYACPKYCRRGTRVFLHQVTAGYPGRKIYMCAHLSTFIVKRLIFDHSTRSSIPLGYGVCVSEFMSSLLLTSS